MVVRAVLISVADRVLESISGHVSRRMLEHSSHIRIGARHSLLCRARLDAYVREPTRQSDAAWATGLTRSKPSSHRTPKRIRSHSLPPPWHRRRERNTRSRWSLRARRNTN